MGGTLSVVMFVGTYNCYWGYEGQLLAYVESSSHHERSLYSVLNEERVCV